jgi:hypothetical protein
MIVSVQANTRRVTAGITMESGPGRTLRDTGQDTNRPKMFDSVAYQTPAKSSRTRTASERSTPQTPTNRGEKQIRKLKPTPRPPSKKAKPLEEGDSGNEGDDNGMEMSDAPTRKDSRRSSSL